jgi:predicted amidohydrolase
MTLALLTIILRSAVADDGSRGVNGPEEMHGETGTKDSEAFRVVGVQYEISESLYSGLERYEAAMDAMVADIVSAGETDLIVFPEYLNVPALIARYAGAVRGVSSMEAALERVLPQTAVDSLPALLRSRARRIHPELLAMWQGIARRYGVALVPGTFFVADNGGDVRNRSYLIDRSGQVVYFQDKVYLTPFEQDVLKLAPGRVDDAKPIRLGGRALGLTICRDTYFDSWEDPFADVDLWVDLRANGERYSPSVRERFTATLPERVRAVDALGGVNASLTGRYLDLFWEGPAYTVDAAGVRRSESPAPTGTSTVGFTLPAVAQPSAR